MPACEARAVLEQDVGRLTGREGELRNSQHVGVHSPEEPRRLMLVEEADRRESVLRAELHARRGRCAVGDGELDRERPGGVVDAAQPHRLVDERAQSREVDLRVRAPVRDGLKRADRPPECVARLRMLDGELVRGSSGRRRADDEAETQQRLRFLECVRPDRRGLRHQARTDVGARRRRRRAPRRSRRRRGAD